MDPEPHATAGPAGASPWRLALRRLRRNRVALAFGGLLVLIVAFVLAAPLWAEHVAETGPNRGHTLEKLDVDGQQREVVTVEGHPRITQKVAGGLHGDVATASITVNSIPKILRVAPGLRTMADMPIPSCFGGK